MRERSRREFLALIGLGAAGAVFGHPSGEPLEVTYYYLPG